VSRYSIGKPGQHRPATASGHWRDEPIVLSMQTRLKIIVRPPDGSEGPGSDAEADRFETRLRRAIAETLVDLESDGYTVVGTVVEQFEDAGG
jgi:hypothetical protein